MIQVMKFVRYFTVIVLSLHVSFALSSSEPMMFPKLKGLGHGGGKVPAVNHAIFLDVFSRLFKNVNFSNPFKNVNIASYATPIMERAMNNPKASIGMAVILIFILGYYSSEVISEYRRQSIKKTVFPYIQRFVNAVQAIMPNWLLSIGGATKVIILKPLADLTQSYIQYNIGYAILSFLSIGTGICTGWSKIGIGGAVAFGFIGLNQVGFDRIEGKIEEVKKEIGRLRDDINNLNKDLTKQIQGVGGKIDNLDTNLTGQIQDVSKLVVTNAQEISQKIGTLEKTLKDDLETLSNNNKEATIELQNSINEAKGFFANTLESNIKSLSEKLIEKMEISNKNTEGDIRYLNDQVEGLDTNLKDLKNLVEILKNNSETQNKKIDDHMLQVSQKISEYSESVNKKLEKLEGDTSEVKNKLNVMQKTVDTINEAIKNQEDAINNLGEKVGNISTKVEQDINSIKIEIENFGKNIEKQAVATTQKILQQITTIRSQGESVFKALKQTFLTKVEEIIKETKAESAALKKDVNATQEAVDNIQIKQNNCVEILTVLQKNNELQDSRISELINLVQKNQKAFDEKMYEVQITSQIDKKEIDEKLDKIQSEVTANKKEILENIGVLGNKISVLDFGIKLIDTKIETTLSKSIGNIQSECQALENSIKNYTEKNVQDKKELTEQMTKLYSSFHEKLTFLADLNDRIKEIEKKQEEQSGFNKKILEALEENKRHQEENKRLSELLSQKIEEQGQKTDNKLNEISSQVKYVAQQGDSRLDTIENKLDAALLGQRLRESRENKNNELELQDKFQFNVKLLEQKKNKLNFNKF